MTAIETAEPIHRRRTLIACGIGNFIEWYDFIVYGSLASVLGAAFFPGGDATSSLLATFAVFAVAFAFRPLGGTLFGHLGDRLGRKNVLAVIVLLTSGSTLAIGVLPTYHDIGVAAPVLLVVCRCVQGLAAGGELSGGAVYVTEQAPTGRRATYAGVIGATAVLGAVGGSGVALLVNVTLTPAAVSGWAWRLPFLVAGPLGLVGFYIRQRLEDTAEFKKTVASGRVERSPLATAVRRHPRAMFVVFGFALAHAAGFYFLSSFLAGYLTTTLHLARSQALAANFAALVLAALVAIGAGRVADSVGRKPLMLAACAWYVAGALPAYLLVSSGDLVWVLIGQCVLAVALGVTSAMVTVVQVEVFPATVRYSGAAVSYNIAQALGGGTAPFVATLLVSLTGRHGSPFVYLMVLAALAFLVVAGVAKETRESPVSRDARRGPVGDRPEMAS